MERVSEALIISARKRLHLTTPYFNIRPSTIQLLQKRARQVVSIIILLPGKRIDKKCERFVADSCIADFITEPTVKMYRYQRSMIHIKAIRLDDWISCVGSPNFNQRSRKKDFDVAMVVQDKNLASTLERHLKDDLALS
ncbi:phospholipase D-like domain-containing protein [Pelagicoccus sp. SDUM812002]|uniref:phospholipase D-like domain-containing protein n=1 Tax=Pelagicoccus sp. SDUM812002 TaxID=3041266 RepID=UPI00280FBA9D|nr:phospholipase D-like domain-containing protein [Pelagicoccus sp. SDUM812002]MDQ8187403.1 phospholipase D-like domain-containing protein [Pelagicoccus sp. SDUM812002]